MRDYKLYLEDIRDAIKKIEKYTRGVSMRKFIKNNLIIDAVIRNLQIIGEAARKIPDSEKGRIPEIEWRRLAGLRNILVHEYFGVDNDILWDVVAHKIPELKRQVGTVLRKKK